ncbi:YbaB/EbfC family nucleoid-associated protein [Saccharopolyspora hirsuta]|uniref:YbaB/EbfC family nucleoid-associated protein n=2 Tax=Saccharopolyspora hirsuta TaxID=1837 RepID=A0A5M7BU29_SACHI|nr:YbaB/EbfC family nucleoid-associated protein [Saccharopolyspora hirsuta]MBF6507920.1 YbaB/EbfC family nucleoid-associated protein [Nocardia farcinica]
MVREWQERAAEKAEKYGQLQQQIEQIVVTESSRDGAIQVTVNSSGILQSLELTESASSRPMAKLGAEIMRTVQLAQSKVPDLVQQVVDDTVGMDDSAAAHMVSESRRFFPEPPEDEEEQSRTSGLREMEVPMEDDYEPPPKPPQQPPRRRPVEDFDDDDFGSGSFLR